MTFNDLVQKRMFLLMVLAFVLFGYFGGTQNIGINKTVGWAWDFTNWLFFAKGYFLPIFIIGYALLAILKRVTHKNLSKTHLFLVILTFVVDDILTSDLRLILTLNLISLIIFIFNLIWSIRNKKIKPNKKASIRQRV